MKTDLETVWLTKSANWKLSRRRNVCVPINAIGTANNFLVFISVKKQVEIPNCNYIVLAMVARDIESRYFSCSAMVHNSEKPEIIMNHLSRMHEMQYIRKAGNYGLKSHSTEIAATRSAIELMEIDQKARMPLTTTATKCGRNGN